LKIICRFIQDTESLFLFLPFNVLRERELDEKAMHAFRNLLVECCYAEKTVGALWKWRDSSEKKGVVSFWQTANLNLLPFYVSLCKQTLYS
jgi:hypothetical protein